MFFFDRRALYAVFLVIFVISIIGVISDPQSLLLLLYCVPGVLCAITFHECAHILVAKKIGDDDAARHGLLTANPLKHIDFIGLIIFLMAGVGWGRQVRVNGANIKGKMSYRTAQILTSLAGPIANFILAFIFMIIYFALYKFNVLQNMDYRGAQILVNIVYDAIILNIGFGVFNLIPLPPLDGFSILNSFLPYKASRWFEENETIFYIAFIILWILGWLIAVITPIRALVYDWIFKLVSMMFGMQI